MQPPPRCSVGAGAGALAAFAPRPAGAALQHRHHARQCAADADRAAGFLAGAPAEARHRAQRHRGHHHQSAALRTVRADRSAAFTEKITDIDAVPRFRRLARHQCAGAGHRPHHPQGDGRLKAEFRLWDVFAGEQLDGKQYFTTPDNWRRIAHIISDAIYETLTGEKGYFDSRVVFVDETGPKDRRVKRLAIMDQDGAGVRYLTRGDDLVLTPRFSPSTQEITYMSYGQGDPRVYLLNIETGQREIVGNFPGMTFAPRFSPDGQRVIMSLQQGGNSNLFVMDLRSKADDAADRHAGDRHRAVLFAGRHAHLLRKRSRRHAADLRHGGERRAGAAHQLRRGPSLDAGVVAARRLHRLHQARRAANSPSAS